MLGTVCPTWQFEAPRRHFVHAYYCYEHCYCGVLKTPAMTKIQPSGLCKISLRHINIKGTDKHEKPPMRTCPLGPGPGFAYFDIETLLWVKFLPCDLLIAAGHGKGMSIGPVLPTTTNYNIQEVVCGFVISAPVFSIANIS